MAGQACGNGIENWLDRSKEGFTNERTLSLTERIMQSAWMPFRPISEEEYENMLNEKLTRVKADISAVDARITAIREVSTRTVTETVQEDRAKH